MVNLALLAAGLLVAACVVSYLLGDSISKGIAKIKEKLHAMEEGQFSHAFDTKLVKRKDEIGEIARSAKNMQDRIGDIIRGIQTESQSVKHSSKNSLVHIEEIHDNVQDISATTQELSAGMEETSASTEEMNALTYEVEAEIAGMKTNTGNGEQLAVEIKKRADLLKQETLASQKTALDIYDATNVQLRESIKKTEAIEEIKELSQTILKITAQTNLLALNASIEAARAGEAGKGFAVVADQIRVLAENSKQAVSRINIITTNVSEAVSGVVEDSQRMLQFVDGQVLKDYERFVDTSNQYYADAEMVQKVVFEINESAAQLYETIQQIRMAIDEVTTATGEGAEGTTGIADKLSSIALKTNEVLEQAQGNRESAERLDQMVEFFQIS